MSQEHSNSSMHHKENQFKKKIFLASRNKNNKIQGADKARMASM
jgi:hypothetical protein